MIEDIKFLGIVFFTVLSLSASLSLLSYGLEYSVLKIKLLFKSWRQKQ